MIYKVYVYVNHETGADTAFFTDFEMAKNDSTLHLLQKIYSFMGPNLGQPDSYETITDRDGDILYYPIFKGKRYGYILITTILIGRWAWS